MTNDSRKTENFLTMDRIGGVPRYPDINKYTVHTGFDRNAKLNFVVWEGDGWKAESMAWKTGVYLAQNLSRPGNQVIYRGPDAQRLFSLVSINDVYDWSIGSSKHLVMTDQNGYVANHGLTIRDGEDTFRQFASNPWASYHAERLKLDVEIEIEDAFIMQVAGPKSLETLEQAVGSDLHDLKFLQTRKINFPGIQCDDIEISRIGMAGTLSYEVRGPLNVGPEVHDAVYKAGKSFDIKRLGWRTYTVNHTEGGFPQMTVSFLPSAYADPGFQNSDYGSHINLEAMSQGSADPSDLRARFRTPHELNWGWMAKFNHDFIGRSAVEAEAANPRRKTVILRWNPDDIADVMASHFRAGEEYKFIDFPSAPQAPAGGNQDIVTINENPVGFSSHAIYSYYYREMISQCVIDVEHIQLGTEVEIHWGDYGQRIKKIRATVERFPYLDLPRNESYDLTKIPSLDDAPMTEVSATISR